MRCESVARRVFAMLGVVLFAASMSQGQIGTTSLHGNVLDKSHAAIGGAKVTLLDPAKGIQLETSTSPTGEFEFVALPPATYTIIVEKDGFHRYEQTAVQLLVNVPTSLNLMLQVGSVATQVEVSAQTETINTSDDSIGTPF